MFALRKNRTLSILWCTLTLIAVGVVVAATSVVTNSYAKSSAVIADDGGVILPGRAAGETGALGVTFGFDSNTVKGAPYTANSGNVLYNLPMYEPTANRALFWQNYAEELDTAGVNFVAVDLRGFIPGSSIPNEAGDPRVLGELVTAIRQAGSNLKIAALDDTPASLTDKKKQIKHHTGGGNPPFDIGDATGAGEGGYQYMWNNNLEAYFKTVPDDMLYKVNNQPLIYTWAISPPFFTNQGNGNSEKMIAYMRAQAQKEFGYNPYFILTGSWITNDPLVASVASGEYGWFNVNNGGTALVSFHGKPYGVAVPGFTDEFGTTHTVIDPNHGQTLVNNLTKTVNAGATLTLSEGFTDWQENAALLRTADGTYDQRHTDYPSQMMNIIRRFSTTPFPTTRRIDAEIADAYHDTTSGNQFATYRAGDIDVQQAGDTGGGWNVGGISAGEWLEWEQLPLQNTVDFKVRVASTNPNGELQFVIDGQAGPVVKVPNTGNWQTYQTIDAGTFNFKPGTYHTVRMVFPRGSFNLNYWTSNNIAG